MNDFRSLLAARELLILDGATGTELARRGVDTGLPLWSANGLLRAPDVVRAIHADYVRAGANIITTNTFRTHRRNLAAAGLGRRARELTHLAVQLAREATQIADRRQGQAVFVAGSMSPLEDCYSPHLVPPDAQLRAEHREIAEHLAEAGCDLLLVETMNTIREAVIAAEAAKSTGLPVCVSFVAGPGGRPPDRITLARSEASAGLNGEEMTLLSGEPIALAVAAVQALSPDVVMVNCVPLRLIDYAFEKLVAAASYPTGVYANVGHADDRLGWTLTDDVLSDAYARRARRWRELGATIIGGCCGTSPEHIAALSAIFRAAAQV